MFLISQQEQDDTLTRGIQTIPSRLSCTTMFCLLWRLVKSRNLLVAMSLHMHWGLHTCYVQDLVAEAPTKAVWEALHLVLLNYDKGLLFLQV